jgi:chromosomal replication initiator protein
VNDADTLWKHCAEELRRRVSEGAWRTSLEVLTPKEFDGSSLTLVAPSAYTRERIESRFLDLICRVVCDVAGYEVKVLVEADFPASRPYDSEFDAEASSFIIDPAQMGARAGSSRGAGHGSRGPAGIGADADLREGGLNPRYTFEAFVTGQSNRFAQAAALSVAEMPARSYNPLFIHGGAGLGKTHLLHAIGNYVLQNFRGKQLRYVSTETFLNEFVDAIRNQTMPAFKRGYRECDVLLIDDVQFMEGKEGLQEEFFHTFNHLYGASKQIVLTSDRPPKSIATLEERLRSRFLSGLIADVQPPDLETRIAILRKKREREAAEVPDEVLEFIATHVKENIRELEGALIRVTAYGSLTREAVSRELAEKVLSDIVSMQKPRPITADMIMEATARHFDFSVDELKGPSRRRPLVIARQVCMYLFRDLTDYSYPVIAQKFGGRDHTTAMHAVEKITKLMGERQQIYNQVTELIVSIKSSASACGQGGGPTVDSQ